MFTWCLTVSVDRLRVCIVHYFDICQEMVKVLECLFISTVIFGRRM